MLIKQLSTYGAKSPAMLPYLLIRKRKRTRARARERKGKVMLDHEKLGVYIDRDLKIYVKFYNALWCKT